MHRMIVRALVLELQAIALPLFEGDRVSIRKGFAIDHPVIERPMAGELRLEDQRDRDYRFIIRRCRDRRRELTIVPNKTFLLLPDRFATMVGVLEHDPHA